MAVYKPLFRITVEHSFRADGMCRDLEFIPAPWTEQLIQKKEIIVRETISGLILFYDSKKICPEELFDSEYDDAGAFCWKVFSKDPFFLNFTQLSVPQRKISLFHRKITSPKKISPSPENISLLPSPLSMPANKILFFDSAKSVPENASALRLHKTQWVSEADQEFLTSPLLKGLLNVRDKCKKPNFCVTVRGHQKISDQKPQESCFPDWRIRFKARETIWKYYLIGEISRDETFIFDKSGVTDFNCEGVESLDNGRTATVFSSKKFLPLQEISECNFQLRKKSPGADKIVIQRLPVATAKHLGRQDRSNNPISQIFINF